MGFAGWGERCGGEAVGALLALGASAALVALASSWHYVVLARCAFVLDLHVGEQ